MKLALDSLAGDIISTVKEHKGSAVPVLSKNPGVRKLSVSLPNGVSNKTTMMIEIYANRDPAVQLFDIGSKLGFPVRLTEAGNLGLSTSQQHILVAK
jgi:hypothetical protein